VCRHRQIVSFFEDVMMIMIIRFLAGDFPYLDSLIVGKEFSVLELKVRRVIGLYIAE
jgi:hypothetical protein